MCMLCGGVLETIGVGIVLATIHKLSKKDTGCCKNKYSGEKYGIIYKTEKSNVQNIQKRRKNSR